MSTREFMRSLILKLLIVVFTNYTNTIFIAQFFQSDNDSYTRGGATFGLQCRLETPGAQLVTSIVCAQRLGGPLTSYSLHIGHDTKVQLWDGLELQVKFSQQIVGERSFLIELTLVDPRMLPQTLEIADKTHSYEVGDKIDK